MKSAGYKRGILMIVLIVVATGIIWSVINRLTERQSKGKRDGSAMPVPVEVAHIQHGVIELRRTFSGRVEKLTVNISDTVSRGQVVAELDNDEYVQAVAQARADLAVARANLAKAKSALHIVVREFERVQTLRKRGVASDSELDAAMAEQTAKQAELEVAEAQVKRAEALLETANIRLGYTQVTAGWTGGTDYRIVAERYVDEGETVSANTPLLLIVEFDPITGIVYVSEKDYVYLQPGQDVTLTTDAFPGEQFNGTIVRIAPVFRQSTRQARVELNIKNPQLRLKPGMFIRATVVLDRMDDAIIIPEQAVTNRDDQTGVFLVNEEDATVTWRTLKVGIREDDRVQVEGHNLSGRVVTLGQQLIDTGSKIIIPADNGELPATGEEAVSR